MVRYMRETVLNLYIPFDKNIVFHKIVAWTAVAFTGKSNLSIRSILMFVSGRYLCIHNFNKHTETSMLKYLLAFSFSNKKLDD